MVVSDFLLCRSSCISCCCSLYVSTELNVIFPGCVYAGGT